jgi:predicted transcriptional regulator
MQYRSRTDIVSQILEAANGRGTSKTKIMYKAFLSYDQLKEYLKMLVENNLLDYDSKSQTFKATVKGHKFLQTYKQMEEEMGLALRAK